MSDVEYTINLKRSNEPWYDFPWTAQVVGVDTYMKHSAVTRRGSLRQAKRSVRKFDKVRTETRTYRP